MKIYRSSSLLVVAVLAVTVFAWAQSRRAGLYEVTSTTTWQQSPFPAGMAPGGGPQTRQVCVTQQQLDKYNGVPPQTRSDCQVSNVAKKADGFTAEIACSGRVAMKGTVESAYTPDGNGTTRVHMLGSMQMGANSKPVEMSIQSTSTYKGADCGSVKPVEDSK